MDNPQVDKMLRASWCASTLKTINCCTCYGCEVEDFCDYSWDLLNIRPHCEAQKNNAKPRLR